MKRYCLPAGVIVCLLCACDRQYRSPSDTSPCLLVRTFPAGKVLARIDIGQTRTFALSFIHSVSLTPVRDEYRIQDGRILQTAEIFETHGAGLPSNAQEPAVTAWEHHGDSFRIRMKRPIPKLIVRTDKKYANRLHSASQVINLNTWPDQALEITLERTARTCLFP